MFYVSYKNWFKTLESTNFGAPDESRAESNNLHVEYHSHSSTSGIALF